MLEFMLVLVCLAAYFAPTLLAVWRRHPKAFPIFLLNLLLGATVIGWIIALFWAFGRGALSARKYDNNSSEFGGMAVSTSARFNLAFVAAFGGLLGIALVAALAVHQVRTIREALAAKVDHDVATLSAAAHAHAIAPASSQMSALADAPKAMKSMAEAPLAPVAQEVSLQQVSVGPAAGEGKARKRPHMRSSRQKKGQKFYVDGVPIAERIKPKPMKP